MQAASSWVRLLAAALVLGACAQAASPESAPVDASVRPADASTRRPIDASLLADAPTDAVMAVSCTSAATCTASTALGTISGDTGFSAQMASGYQSAWYNVRVTENDNNLFGVPETITVTLTSPVGSTYDVFVYVNTGSDVIDCTTPNGTPTVSGSTDSVSLSWGEGEFSNGKDDSRTVSIEVRPVSGTCSSGATWQLLVEGDVGA